MATILTGGGYGSRQHTDKKVGQKVEPVTHRANVAGVAQQGMATAFKKEPLIQDKGYEPARMPATGVPGNYNSAPQGPGSGRTVYASGSQSTYGKVDPGQVNRATDVPATKPGRDILSMYGPELKRGR